MCYDYEQLAGDINTLTENFSFIEHFSIGDSIMEKPIPCLRIGNGELRILLAGAFHGLEYLTAAFLIRFASDYAIHIVTGTDFFGCNAGDIYKNTSVYIVPMVNPDGVDIAVNGLDITNPYHRALISMAGIHSFNSVWRANAQETDPDCSYDAKWSMIIEKRIPTKYGGEYPESEPETRAITKLIRSTNFDMLLAFHSQGCEIYYDFDGFSTERSRRLAEKMPCKSCCSPSYPEKTSAFGDCASRFDREFGRSGFTVEIGSAGYPAVMSRLDGVYEENARLTLCALKDLCTGRVLRAYP